MATGDRQLVALLGHPVAHSLSPRMQNAAFLAAGLDWEYVLRDVQPEELEAAVGEVEFANVTAPYKLDVARILSSELPSVNTIARGRGFSTDAAILEQVTDCYRPAIVGDGGAAAAFRQALPGARVFSRRGEWPPDVIVDHWRQRSWRRRRHRRASGRHQRGQRRAVAVRCRDR